MERGGRRRAFGSSICPNSVQCTPAHLAKKAARHVGCTARPLPTVPRPRAPLPRLRRNSTPPVRAAPIYALTSPDWQDMAACAPILPASLAGSVTLQQGRCFQDGPELNFQEFRDAGDSFIADTPTLMPPLLDCDDFDFSLGEEVAFSPCISQLESSTLAQIPLQRLPSPELCWRDLAGQHQKALGDTLEANSQLQETVMQRQEELVMPKGCNVQLKELASQARQLAEVLDTLMLPQCADGAALSPSPHPPPAVAAPAGISSGPERRKEAAGVDAMLRDVSEKCRAALQSLGASPETKARSSPGKSPEETPVGSPEGRSPGEGSPTTKRPRPAPTLHGVFRGLSNLRAEQRPVGGGVAGGDSLRVALGQAGGIRTLTFPQGSAFTMRTDGGGYRLLWVPR